jgi:hypothetical protein
MRLSFRVFGPPPNVFVSYSRHDAAFAQRLGTDLAAADVGVTLDLWEFRVGDSLRQKIDAAVTHSDYIIVVLTPESVRSKWCQIELSAALIKELSNNSVVLLPALLRECEIPPTISGKLYADFTVNYEEGLGFLLDAIRQDEGSQRRFQPVHFPTGIPRSFQSPREGKEMLLVPAGRLYSKDFGRGVEIKEHLFVDSSYITNDEFKRFVEETGYRSERPYVPYDRFDNYDSDHADSPRVWVTAHDALAYAEWSKRRLLTSDEWLRSQHVYPQVFDEDRNMWEWTCTKGETHNVDGKTYQNYLLLGGYSFGTPMSSTFTRAVYVPADACETFVSFRCCMASRLNFAEGRPDRRLQPTG